MTVFDLVSIAQGIPVTAAAKELTTVARLTGEDFLNYQHKRKWEIFNYHIVHNSYYRNHISKLSIRQWEDIPVLQKSDIQVPLQSILTEGYQLTKVYRNNTSGSTGKPFHFAKDKFAHAMTWAYIVQRYKDLDISYGRSLQARFFGIPLSKAKFLKETLKDRVSARVRFPVFDLSDEVLSRYLNTFYKHNFVYIYGYTSSLVLFARFVLSQNKSLVSICPSLKWCIVTSEVCSIDDKIILQKAFGVPVIQEYGAAELDIIGFEDRNGNWKLNEENLFIEILDDRGKEVAPGEEGNVVVTSLYNKAMPFIRYNLGDIVALEKDRVGNHRIIKSIRGRTNDVAILPSGKKSPGLTFYYISKGLLESGGFMKEFIIKQTQPDHFHFEYVATADLTDEQKGEVQKMMDLYLEPGLTASFERKEVILRSASGKFKHFQYLVNAS